MGIYIYSCAVDSNKVSQVYNSKDETLLTQAIKENWFSDNFEEYSQEQALNDIILGKPYKDNVNHVYGYAVITLCHVLGQNLPYSQDIKLGFETDIINQILAEEFNLKNTQVELLLMPDNDDFSFIPPPVDFPLIAVHRQKELQHLAKLFENTSIDLVIIRPPLIYAHDAPGNFSKLLMLIKLGQFLPFGCTHNQRSFIVIENLVSFITACIYHDTKINETFLIADDEVISTKQLIQCLSSGMGKSMILLPVPTKLLSTLADVTGKVSIFEQLYGNLQIDNRKAKKFFNWHPPKHSLNALKEVGNLYRNNKK